MQEQQQVEDQTEQPLAMTPIITTKTVKTNTFMIGAMAIIKVLILILVTCITFYTTESKFLQGAILVPVFVVCDILFFRSQKTAQTRFSAKDIRRMNWPMIVAGILFPIALWLPEDLARLMQPLIGRGCIDHPVVILEPELNPSQYLPVSAMITLIVFYYSIPVLINAATCFMSHFLTRGIYKTIIPDEGTSKLVR